MRVRSPQAGALREALAREGIEATETEGVLFVRGTTSERVGEVAAAERDRPARARERGSSLEEVFLELTADRRDPVIGQTRSEFLKIRSTRTTIGLVVGLIALVLLFVLLTGLPVAPGELTAPEDQRNFLGIGSFASVFAALAGILVVTSEYRFGTIRPTFVFTPRRWVVVTAKYAASLLAGIVFALIGQGLTLAIGLGILSGRGIHRSLGWGSVAQLGLGTLAAAALWGGIGVGVGAIVRNHIGAVIGVLVWVFVVENLLFGFVPSVGRFTPGRATNAAHRHDHRHLLPAAAGGACSSPGRRPLRRGLGAHGPPRRRLREPAVAEPLTGVLLVGGASRRFGSPKALARFGHETLAGRAWRLLGSVCDERLAVGKPGEGEGLPFPVADDGTDVRAPLAGLVAGLRTARTELIVALPVDCPLLEAADLRALAAACADAAVPQTGPLPGAYRRARCPCSSGGSRPGS